jgi:hypothetical protein
LDLDGVCLRLSAPGEIDKTALRLVGLGELIWLSQKERAELIKAILCGGDDYEDRLNKAVTKGLVSPTGPELGRRGDGVVRRPANIRHATAGNG